MVEFINENGEKLEDSQISFDIVFKSKMDFKIDQTKQVDFTRRQVTMFANDEKESVRCFIEDLAITKALRIEMLLMKLPKKLDYGSSYKSIPHAFKIVDRANSKEVFWGMILVVNKKKEDVGVSYEELF